MEELSQHQVKELLSYLQFERQKRREIRGEISGDLSDIMKEKFEPETVYSGTEAHEILSDVPDTIAHTVDEELIRQRDISINLMSQIFLKAQEKDFIIELSIPELENESATDAANLLAGKILMNETKIMSTAENKQENDGEKQISQEELQKLRDENEKLKSQLLGNKRNWPEFIEAQKKLKDLNAEVHELKAKLGEE